MRMHDTSTPSRAASTSSARTPGAGMVVTRSVDTHAHTVSGSIPGGITHCAPIVKWVSTRPRPATWNSGMPASSRSSAETGRPCARLAFDASHADCERRHPFGRPVVPDVYSWRTGTSGLGRASSPGGSAAESASSSWAPIVHVVRSARPKRARAVRGGGGLSAGTCSSRRAGKRAPRA